MERSSGAGRAEAGAGDEERREGALEMGGARRGGAAEHVDEEGHGRERGGALGEGADEGGVGGGREAALGGADEEGVYLAKVARGVDEGERGAGVGDGLGGGGWRGERACDEGMSKHFHVR